MVTARWNHYHGEVYRAADVHPVSSQYSPMEIMPRPWEEDGTWAAKGCFLVSQCFSCRRYASHGHWNRLIAVKCRYCRSDTRILSRRTWQPPKDMCGRMHHIDLVPREQQSCHFRATACRSQPLDDVVLDWARAVTHMSQKTVLTFSTTVRYKQSTRNPKNSSADDISANGVFHVEQLHVWTASSWSLGISSISARIMESSRDGACSRWNVMGIVWAIGQVGNS